MDFLFKNKACMAFAALLLFCLTANAQPWTFTGPGEWDDPSKWSPSYPGLNIAFSEVTLNGDCDLEDNTLNFSGGIIFSNGNLTSSGGGVLNMSSGSNFQNNGSMTHGGAGGLTLNMSGGSFTNANPSSSLTFAADYTSGGGLITNTSSLLVNANVNGVVINNTSTGTVTGTGSLGFTGYNEGILGSPTLTLDLNGVGSYTNSGQFHIYHNATLGSLFQNTFGTLTIHPGATLSIPNPGNLHISSPVNINGTVVLGGANPPNFASGAVSIGNGGELRLNDLASFLVNAGATLNNAGTISTTSGTGNLTLNGGTLNNTGTITHNTAALTLALTSGTFNNNSGGVLNLHSNLNLFASSMLNNAAGATINVNNTATLTVLDGTTFSNAGTVKSATGQTGTLSIAFGGTFNNSGTVEHKGTTGLDVQLNGTFNNQSGGLLRLVENAYFSAGTFNNQAGGSIDLNFKELWLTSSHVFNHSGSTTGTGNFVVSGGTLNNSGVFTHNTTNTSLFLYSNGKINILAGGSLVFNSPFTVVDGLITNMAGTMTINAPFTTSDSLTIASGGTLNLNSSLQLSTAAAVLNLGGTFTPSNAFLGINQSTLNLSGSLSVSLTGGGSVVDLDFPQGTINVLNSGNLTFNDDFLFGIQIVNVQTGGTLVIPSGKSLTIINTGILNNQATLTLGGTLTIWSDTGFLLGGASATNVSGTLNLYAGAPFTPASGATLSVSSSGSFQVANGAAFSLGSGVVFNNAGTVAATGGTGTFFIDGGTFNNTGNLTHSSQLTLAITSGTLNNNSGGVLTFSQNFTYGSGTLNNNSGGQLTVSQPFTIAAGQTLTSAGTLTNSGGIVNNGTMLQTGGQVNNNGDWSGSGALTINGGTFENADDLTGQAITVVGTTSVFNNNSGTVIFSVSSTISGGGIFENKTGGTFQMVNCGLNVSGGSTLTLRGAISISNGTLFLYGVLNNHATDLRQQPGFLNIVGYSSSTIHNYGTLTIHSTFWETYSTVNNHAGAIFSIEYGTGFFRGSTVNDGSFVSTTGGRIRLDANFLNNGTITNNEFTLGQFYTFTNTGTCTFVGQLDFYSNAVNAIVNSGTLNLNGGFMNITPGSGYTILTNTGTVNTNGNFTSNFQWNITNSNIFNQNGYLTFFHGNSSFQVDGTLNIAAGKALHIECALKGSGTINNTGFLYTPAGATLRPGTSPGTLSVAHDYNLNAAAYHCEINGTAAGSQHDVIAVSGAATLTNANLVVSWGFTPTAGQTFDIMTFSSRVGTFASVTIPPVAGINFTVSYTSTKVTLNAQVLPVELIDFIATPLPPAKGKEGASVLLEWATASELDADRFEVEHSTDGLSFGKIGERQAAGTATEQQAYEFFHEQPAVGVNYYRLRQVDFNGAFEYSKMVAVDLSGSENLAGLGLLLYPNPPKADSELNIRLTGIQFDFGSYAIFDAMGRLVQQGELEANGSEFQVRMNGHLPTGNYAIQLKDKELRSVAVQRFEVVN